MHRINLYYGFTILLVFGEKHNTEGTTSKFLEHLKFGEGNYFVIQHFFPLYDFFDTLIENTFGLGQEGVFALECVFFKRYILDLDGFHGLPINGLLEFGIQFRVVHDFLRIRFDLLCLGFGLHEVVDPEKKAGKRFCKKVANIFLYFKFDVIFVSFHEPSVFSEKFNIDDLIDFYNLSRNYYTIFKME